MRISKYFQKVYFTILKKNKIDIQNFFSQIEKLDYAVLKFDTPYMPKDFPHKYPIGKDLDIFVSEKDFEKIRGYTRKMAQSSNWKWELKEINEKLRYKLRFVWHNSLHYQIDIICSLDNEKLEELLLKNRTVINDLIYIPCIEIELLYRALEYEKFKRKKHHYEYLNKNRMFWDNNLSSLTGIRFPGSE